MNVPVIFDLGGVLIDWNPRYLFRKLFETESEMEYFLNEICSSEWNLRQDAGRSFSEGIQEMITGHPDYAELIKNYFDRWEEMLGPPIYENVGILERLQREGFDLYAITNWSSETFLIAKRKFEFLGWFSDIIVSGEVKLMKPDPAIYHLLIEKHCLTPSACIFIDDNIANIETAEKIGFQTIHFHPMCNLERELKKRGV